MIETINKIQSNSFLSLLHSCTGKESKHDPENDNPKCSSECRDHFYVLSSIHTNTTTELCHGMYAFLNFSFFSDGTETFNCWRRFNFESAERINGEIPILRSHTEIHKYVTNSRGNYVIKAMSMCVYLSCTPAVCRRKQNREAKGKFPPTSFVCKI